MTVDPGSLPWASAAGGPSRARQAMCDYLIVNLPLLLEGIRRSLHIDETILPDPLQITPALEGLWAVELYPTVAVGQTGPARNFQRKEFAPDGGSRYEITYPMRITYWLKTAGENASIAGIGQRDAYQSAIRSIVIGRGSFGTAGMNPDDGRALIRTDESTLTETPYDPTYDKYGVYITAGETTFDIVSTEKTVIGGIGTVLTVDPVVTTAIKPYAVFSSVTVSTVP